MYNLYKTNVTIEKMRQDEETVNFDQNSYFISYPEFLKYFNDLNSIDRHNLITGINFTYGWMPTIFDFRSEKIDEAIEILNSAKKGVIPTERELDILKKCFNNSLIGTSKLLHFINPNRFAIWDSRVFRYLTQMEPHSYRLEKSSSYLDYLRFCEDITGHSNYEMIHASMTKKIRYLATPFRTSELIMFFHGKN